MEKINKKTILIFENISKSYKDGEKNRNVLQAVSGSVKKGSINVIYGESGCGKTTLLSILSGIETPDQGEVIFNDISYYSLPLSRQTSIRGKKFGIVFQDYNLVDELTAADNIKLPLIINKIKFDDEYYHRIIKRLKLSELEERYPNEISGGEKQRVAIARAMIIKPDIIFADEPTGNLDEKNTREVVAILEDINEMLDTTLIVVTHNKSLFTHPDQIINIQNGNLYTGGH